MYSANFSPTLLHHSAPEVIHCDFTGGERKIPVTVNSTPAITTFSVYTQDNTDQIVDNLNGFLTCHYTIN